MTDIPDVAGPHISVDRDRCQGTGSCVFHAENTFDLDDGNRVVVLAGRDPAAAVRAAADSCPTEAITVTTGTVTTGTVPAQAAEES